MLHQLTCETMGAAIIASHPFCSKVPFIVHDSVARLSSHIAKDFFLSLKLWESARNFEIYALE